MKRFLLGFTVVALLGGAFAFSAPPARKPSAAISVDPATITAGGSATLTWEATNASKVILATATTSGQTATEVVEASGTRAVTPAESTAYRLYAKRGFRTVYAEAGVDVAESDDTPAPAPDPEPTPEPTPVEGFSLSAVGIGSAFGIDDALSSASRDHELGAFIASQNGTWTIITDEVMAADHPKAFDDWSKELAESGKTKPAVIWHNAGKVLAIDEVVGKSKADLLAMAKAAIPEIKNHVVIRGKTHSLGLLSPKLGAKYSGPSVSALLKPLSSADCPSVDLSSQVLWYKNQTGGTCVLNAFSGACESAIYAAYGKANALELSPYFLANLTNGYNGTYAADGAETVQKYGNLPFGDMDPYDKLPAGWKKKSANYKCLAVYGPPESDSPGYLRAALNRGYIACAGISCGNGFDPDASGYISYDRGAGRSINHEIRVVGWDREKRRFKIANSWGKDWGLSGSAWLDEKFFEEDTDMWVVVGMVANPDFKFYSPVESDKEARGPVLNPKITASATQITAGDQAIVMWTNTTSTVLCTLNGQAVAINGQQEVYPTKDATFSVIAYDRKGNTQVSWVRIEVLPAPAKKATLEGPIGKAIEAAELPPAENAATPRAGESPCANGSCRQPRERSWRPLQPRR
jgi:hypothetical protein